MSLEDRLGELGPRRRIIVEYAAAGATERWIAHDLGISLQTVKNQKSKGYRVLGVSGIIELILRRQEERMETNKFVVIGKYEDSGGHEYVIVSREVTAPTKEIAETIFRMTLEGEGMGTPIIETSYGPYERASVIHTA